MSLGSITVRVRVRVSFKVSLFISYFIYLYSVDGSTKFPSLGTRIGVPTLGSRTTAIFVILHLIVMHNKVKFHRLRSFLNFFTMTKFCY